MDKEAHYKGLYEQGISIIDALDKQNDELKKENEKLKADNEKYVGIGKAMMEAAAEVERLKFLIKESFIALNLEWQKSLAQIDADWEQYKIINNI